MAQRTVRYLDSPDPGSFEWDFAGRLRRTDDNGEPVAHPDDLQHCTATDLKFALGLALGESGDLSVVDASVNPDDDVEEVGFFTPVSFGLRP
ncbi:MAG TPA: hypothetical protein VMA72_14160 [Streptosporangiaceae bacterium]|nr:hypothetical protein [Streptosporangiaceae bacterium]